MAQYKANFENFEPKFETAYSHLDDRDAIANPILLHQKPLIIGQFGQQLHPVIYPSGLVMLNPRWTADTYNLFIQNIMMNYMTLRSNLIMEKKKALFEICGKSGVGLSKK